MWGKSSTRPQRFFTRILELAQYGLFVVVTQICGGHSDLYTRRDRLVSAFPERHW